jgi:hypothetical protein
MPHPFASAILEAQPDTAAPEVAAAVAGGPSNQQILAAAKAAYSTFQPVVDATALAVVATVQDSSLSGALTTLDDADWSGTGVTPTVAAPFFDSSEVATALGVVTRNSMVKSFSVGAFSNTLTSGPGVAGYVRDVLAITAPTGLLVELDIFKNIVKVDPGQNLQYGVWLPAPADLHDTVLGMYLNASIQGVSVNLKILLTASLSAYGFMASTGADVPISVGVFAGATSQRS